MYQQEKHILKKVLVAFLICSNIMAIAQTATVNLVSAVSSANITLNYSYWLDDNKTAAFMVPLT